MASVHTGRAASTAYLSHFNSMQRYYSSLVENVDTYIGSVGKDVEKNILKHEVIKNTAKPAFSHISGANFI